MKQNFLNLPPILCSRNDSAIALLSIPYEATTTYGKGTSQGPDAIIRASQQVEFYDEELDLEPCQVGIETIVPAWNFGPEHEANLQKIYTECRRQLDLDKLVVGVGGEHSISIALIRAFREKFENLWVLQLDAHSDIRDEYGGSRLNHACTMARVQELCPFLGLGIRSTISGEKKYVRDPSQIIHAHEMRDASAVSSKVLQKIGNPVYITIDLDFFDPSIMPSVGTPEPGGFYWNDTLSLLRHVVSERTIVGFDVVELAPQPGVTASDFTAAKLIYKLIGYIFEQKLRAMPHKKNLDS